MLDALLTEKDFDRAIQAAERDRLSVLRRIMAYTAADGTVLHTPVDAAVTALITTPEQQAAVAAGLTIDPRTEPDQWWQRWSAEADAWVDLTARPTGEPRTRED